MKIQLLFLLAALPLSFVGCTTTNPSDAFNALRETVQARTGQEVHWFQQDQGVSETVAALLRSNLTAESAAAIALLNNRELQARFEELGVSQADLAQASRLRNPSYSGNFRLPTHGPTTLNTENSLTQDILALLTLPARKKLAAQNLEQTRLRVADAVLKTAADAKTAFYTVQARQQLLKRLQAIMELNQAGVELSLRQHQAGNITDLDLANQEASFQEIKLEWGKTQAQLRLDRERFNRALGLWGAGTAWKVADELPPIPAQEISVNHLEALAIKQRLDLAAARIQVASLAGAMALKKRFRYLPGARLGVDAEQDLDHSWVIGPTLDLEIPLFDQGQPALVRLAAQYRQARRQTEALATDIRSQVRQARDSMIAARDVAEFYRKIYLPQRLRIVNETLLQYHAMQKGPFELMAAKERELSAERGYAEAWRDYWIARSELERAVGGNLQGETEKASERPLATTPPPQQHTNLENQ